MTSVRRPALLFSLTLTVAVLGPLCGSAPTAHADFLANVIASQPSLPESAPFQTFYREPVAADFSWDGAAGSSETSDLPARGLPDSIPPNELPPDSSPGCMPFTAGSGGGGVGGRSSGFGHGLGDGSTTAGLSAAHLPDPDAIVGLLALKETSSRPLAFRARLFRPPRKG
jgi:hypothetical protein